MKKIILLLFLVTTSVFSQETKQIGTYKLNYEKFKGKPSFGTWYEMTEDTFVIKQNISTIGAKNCIELTEEILKALNVDFAKPLSNKTYLSSIVKNIHDYEILNLTIGTEDSVVEYIWLSEKYVISLHLKKDLYTVAIVLR
jgi:hypothetical protein